MLGTGIPLSGLLLLVLLGFMIATLVNTFAMEAAVLFAPAFLFVFPVVVPGFPPLSVNAAIGLALFVELFGYSSSVAAYWYRHQIDFNIAAKLLIVSIPAAVLARTVSYYVPSTILMLGFGGLLVTLAITLYEAHEHGPSILERTSGWSVPVGFRGPESSERILDRVFEKPELSMVSVLHEDYEPRTRVASDRNGAEESPPSQTMGGPAEYEREKPNGNAIIGDGENKEEFHLELPDFLITLLGGTLAGFVGIAIGELTQAMLTLRKRVPLKLSTGTSAIVLHLTVVAVLLMNIALLRFAPSITGEGFTVPFRMGAFIATGCLFGGQAGAYLNNRLSENTIMAMLISVYFLVGIFVVVKTLFLGAGAH